MERCYFMKEFKSYPKSGMPPKKAKKPLKRTAIKKNYDKIFNTSKKLEKRKSSKSNREVIPGDIQDLFGAKKKSSKRESRYSTAGNLLASLRLLKKFGKNENTSAK